MEPWDSIESWNHGIPLNQMPACRGPPACWGLLGPAWGGLPAVARLPACLPRSGPACLGHGCHGWHGMVRGMVTEWSRNGLLHLL